MKQQRGFIVVLIGMVSFLLLASVIGFSLVKVTAKAQPKTTAATFSLAGEVRGECIGCKPPLSCPPFPGVTITFTRVSGTGVVPPPVQTDADGKWSQIGFEEGTTYRVTPGEIQGKSFSPLFSDRIKADAGADFIVYSSYSVSGRVVLNGIGMDGVTIHVNGPEPGGGPCYPRYYPTHFTGQTDANGNWTVPGIKAGIVPYVIYPTKPGYVFTPCPLFLSSLDQSNFEASPVSLAVVSSADFNYRPGFCSYPTVAQEAIVTAFGSNLSATTQVATTQPLPTELAGTSIKIKDEAGVERDAPLFFVSPNQINFQVPPGVSAQSTFPTASIKIMRNGAVVKEGNLSITDFQPAFFTADASGKGLPAAVLYRLKANGTDSYEPISRFDPVQNKLVAVPIEFGDESEQDFLVLFGTGGKTSLGSYQVTIGGTPAEVTYVGPQISFVGLIQTNVRLPRSLIGRGQVEVRLLAAGREANPVTINIH